ncbi:DNA polymerase IV [Fodinisporobacter ferrooxydans]|uniref:DNA polymerase IV n=1 Tax=Fodinisporobacter ferrooxydans TaxID=2901836 RepID=A0ABY4CS60_9BACL|nr:DNA polymerase IV [Alicyclobacillaceae bacterium MYW30-H2]
MQSLRTILHLDMDAFFASIEQRDHPELRGKPVIVGGSIKERGVVATCSYEARRFGVHSAMPTVQAKRLCPNGIFLPVDRKKYVAVSKQLFRILERYSPVIEPLSIDEAFLDVTGCEKLFGSSRSIALQIKQSIQRELYLSASVGISYNKFLAKLASDLKKPNGLVEIKPEDLTRILHPLPISRFWGIGKKTEEKLQRLGLRTIGDVARMSIESMRQRIGSLADHIYQLSHGIDERPVKAVREVKSISQETTFATDVTAIRVLESALLEQVTTIARNMRRKQFAGKTITLKLRFAPFQTVTKRHTLSFPTADDHTLYAAAKQLLNHFEISGTKAIRLIGVSVSQFSHISDIQQISLFEDIHAATKKKELAKAVDAIKDRFGEHILTRASLIQKEGQNE